MPRLWLDTSIFTDAVQNHDNSEACRNLLDAVEHGRVEAVLDPVVLCEIAYMLVKPIFAPRGAPTRTPRQVAEYLLSVVGWAGVEVMERDVVIAALDTWRQGRCDDLVDAFIHSRAEARGEHVCTINRQHFPDSVHPTEALGGQAPPPRRKRRRRRL